MRRHMTVATYFEQRLGRAVMDEHGLELELMTACGVDYYAEANQ